MNKPFLGSVTNAEWAGQLCRVPWEARAGDLAVWPWARPHPFSGLNSLGQSTVCSLCAPPGLLLNGRRLSLPNWAFPNFRNTSAARG